MPKKFSIYFQLIISVIATALTVHIIISASPSMKELAALLGFTCLAVLVGFLDVYDVIEITKQFHLVETINRSCKLVEYQDATLIELKNHNDKITKFMVEQAEMLAKMTSVAMQSKTTKSLPTKPSGEIN